ncbi:hypothetical protein PV11_05318 [Exophiala sideris]|uniref:Uncharacterized protein n=1 Tax=Exophiala sideris TaxID=1016849 RepID=A0A0D1W3A1_9EURO|nr:hypothetical protein PV11_05318 [Exophiala sideris]
MNYGTNFWSKPAPAPAPVTPPHSPQQDVQRKPRAGHFKDLSRFMISTSTRHREEPQYFLNDLPWKLGHDANLEPGTIIYIRDKSDSTRICDRVMLVLRENTESSVTCLSFCWHPDLERREQKTHVPVKTEQAATPPTPTTSPSAARSGAIVVDPRRLAVEVELHLRKEMFSSQRDVYLNCEELWNVEREVDVAVLGQVPLSSFKLVCDVVTRLFSASLKKAIEDIESPQSPAAPAVIVPATSGNAPEGNSSYEPQRNDPPQREGRPRGGDARAGRRKYYHEQPPLLHWLAGAGR